MNAPLVVLSPVAGWVVPLDAVPDPVFAERMLGDGIAIDPLDGVVRAPVAGRIVSVHAARHAVTILSDAGAELLVHVGLETVALGGAGFEATAIEGARVTAGDPLLVFDLDTVGRTARSLLTPVILTNGDAFAIEAPAGDRLIETGEPLFRVIAKREALPEATTAAATGPALERALRLPLRHGLHARPAARIAQAARGFAATIEIAAADGRTASARSPVALLALALPHGAPLIVRATGINSAAAADAIAELIASGMGEGAPFVETAAIEAQPAPEGPLPSALRGVTAAPGLAIGPAFRLAAERIAVSEQGSGVEPERRALAAALDRLRADLDAASIGDGAGAEIAAAHLAFLSDPELLAETDRLIATGRSAGFAWRRALGRFEALLGASQDARFAARRDDLRDLDHRLLAALTGAPTGPAVPAGAILIADELLPSQLMALARAALAGIATGGGGPTSHVAIIAAGMGLPMLAALGGDVVRIADGTPLLLDTADATLEIAPSTGRVAALRDAEARAAAFRIEADTRAHDLALTRDGARIEVFANLGSEADAHAARRAGAEGCGLLRTEFLFLDRAAAPDREEQRACYQAIADALAGHPLIVRTLDIGADKPAPYLPLPPEENPALGLRGLRLGLARPELMEAQLAALVRVEGDVRIMLPMVVEPGEVERTRAMLDRIAAEAGRKPPELGIMVETPAAAMMAAQLAGVADFFSVGSNDLTQYALAMDRGNPAVARGLDGLHPAVLRLIALTVEGARTGGRWVGVCGGIAADPLAVPLLVGLGITELSVPPSAVARIKEHVRRVDHTGCEALVRQALAASDAATVRGLVKTFVEGEVVEGEGA